jgi:hypothetical protein
MLQSWEEKPGYGNRDVSSDPCGRQNVPADFSECRGNFRAVANMQITMEGGVIKDLEKDTVKKKQL